MEIINFMERRNKKYKELYGDAICDAMNQTITLTSMKLLLLNYEKYDIERVKLIDGSTLCKCLDESQKYLLEHYTDEQINAMDNIYNFISDKAVEILIDRYNLHR